MVWKLKFQNRNCVVLVKTDTAIQRDTTIWKIGERRQRESSKADAIARPARAKQRQAQTNCFLFIRFLSDQAGEDRKQETTEKKPDRHLNHKE